MPRCRQGFSYWPFMLFLTLFRTVISHSCSHIPPQPHEVVYDVPLVSGSQHSISKRSVENQLRIHLVYDGSISKLREKKQTLIKNELIPSAVAYWESTLKVRHSGGTIKLLRQCNSERVRYRSSDPYPYCVDGCKEVTKCGETIVPATHLEACKVAPGKGDYKTEGYSGAGVEQTDFVLYISALTTNRCHIGSTVAYAAYCQLERAYDRPVAGYVNLCPDAIKVEQHDLHQMESTIRHEILHALGFSAGLFAFFRSPEGVPYTNRSLATGKPPFNTKLQLYQWSEDVVKTVVRDDWAVRDGVISKKFHMVVTPRVKEEVRLHFGCDDLEGAELEDQGIIGTALTHWEKRVFENEVMTGTYTQSPLMSRITLALLEDSGWYIVDYSQAEQLEWGRHLGCDFIMKSCKHWIDRKQDRAEHIHPFCNRAKRRDALQTECTENRQSVALCNLVEFNKPLPREYQHFDSIHGVTSDQVTHFGGSVALADYCPYVQELNWKKGSVAIRGSKCHLERNNADPEINYTLERYGNRSKCFEHLEQWQLRHCGQTYDVEHWGSGCYQYACNQSGLFIEVQGQQYQCYRQGQVIDIQEVTSEWLHLGSIICPSCIDICQSEGVQCPAEVSPPDRSIVDKEVPCSIATVVMATYKIPFVILILSILW